MNKTKHDTITILFRHSACLSLVFWLGGKFLRMYFFCLSYLCGDAYIIYYLFVLLILGVGVLFDFLCILCTNITRITILRCHNSSFPTVSDDHYDAPAVFTTQFLDFLELLLLYPFTAFK